VRLRLLAAATVVFVLVLTAPAAAGPPGQWTRLPGTVINFAEPGLARTGDGVLHIVYVRKNGTKNDLAHVAVTPAGKVGADSVALGGWAAMSHPDLLRMPDNTLRAFFGGISAAGSGLYTATASASGRPWTLQPGRAAQALYAYATSVTGAGLAKDGTPISTWSGTPGLGFHYGIDPKDPDGKIPQTGCCLYDPDIAVDSASGQGWVGFYSNENAGPGLYVNAIGPTGPQGGRRLAPGSVTGKSSIQPGNRTAITGRIGAAGVYLFYGQGYPTYKNLALWRVDRAKPVAIRVGRPEHANVSPAPDGRLWLMWEQDGVIVASRTNKTATRLGAANLLRPPGGGTIYRLSGEGSAGPLDLIANVQVGGAPSLWHQQVLPKLTLSISERRSGVSRTITYRVVDAGDPVSGATVKAAGKTLKTNAKGIAVLRNAPAGRIKLTVTKPGYAPANT